jgi:hypothetical protein
VDVIVDRTLAWRGAGRVRDTNLANMRAPLLVLSLSALLLPACGGDDACDPGEVPAGNLGFTRPTGTTTAYTASGTSWTEVGPADWSCLGTPGDDQASTVAIAITGEVIARNSDTRVPGAVITAWAGNDVSQTPLDEATADAEGAYELTLPVGTARVAYRASAAGYLDTYLLNQIYQPGVAAQTQQQDPVAISTADTLVALLGLEREPGTGVLAGAIRDCAGHEVEGAVATVSSTSGSATHVDGATTFYFSATATSVPVIHNQQAVTNRDGRFLVVGLEPAARVFIQVWGVLPGEDPACAPLTLLAELEAPALGDAIVTASLEARRSN